MIGDRWGTTPAERSAPYPCDEHLPDPTMAAWRSVTVDAPSSTVWAWLVQVRLAPYSYDWLDNLGRRSPQELRHLDDPVPGDPFTASAGRPLGEVLAVEHRRHLTARVLGAVMTYRLAEQAGGTRLTLKVVASPPRGLATALCVGDLVMARRQLLNLKRLAESSKT